MAYSRIIQYGDGITDTFSVNFKLGYISQANVTCRVGTEVTNRAITFVTPSLIKVAGAKVATGVRTVFERTVVRDQLLVDYENGDILNAVNLNTSQKQVMMLVQEVMDGRLGTMSQDLDMGTFGIKNVRDPVNAQDAVTKHWAETELRIESDHIDGLGTAAYLDVGTDSGDVVQLGPTGLPAVNAGSLQGLSKSQVGLERADNTNDAEKPISDAAQAAITQVDARIHALSESIAYVGFSGNYADLLDTPALGPLAVLDLPMDNTVFLRGDGVFRTPAGGGSGGGDMLQEDYDGDGRKVNVYAMDNMVEGTNTKILTGTERAAIATISDKQDNLGFTPENVANRGTAGGYASLDSGGKVPIDQISAAITGKVDSVAGLTGAISANNLRSALDLVVGSDVLAYDPALAGITTAGKSIIGAASGDAQRLLLDAEQRGLRANIPYHTGSFTFALGDRGALVLVESATASTVTVPTNAVAAFPNRTWIDVIRLGTGAVQIVPASGVSLFSKGNNRNLADTYSAATLIKIGTNEWIIIGDLD